MNKYLNTINLDTLNERWPHDKTDKICPTMGLKNRQNHKKYFFKAVLLFILCIHTKHSSNINSYISTIISIT